MSKGMCWPPSITDRLPRGSWYLGSSMMRAVSSSMAALLLGERLDDFLRRQGSHVIEVALVGCADLRKGAAEALVDFGDLLARAAQLGVADDATGVRHAQQVDVVGEAVAEEGIGGRIRIGLQAHVLAEVAQLLVDVEDAALAGQVQVRD